MTTGFIDRAQIYAARSLAALLLVSLPLAAHATDISVMGLFNGKAVLVIDGGKPRSVNAGQTTPEGVRLVSASSESAVVEFGGQRQTLTMGHATRIGASTASSGAGQVTLKAGGGGHFFANGWINGSAVRFMVDTGATMIALSIPEAKRLGINYLSGTRMAGHSASGVIRGYNVKLDTVRVGDITLHNVDAAVLEGAGPSEALLGMSFLNRTQMNRDGDTLTLTRRF